MGTKKVRVIEAFDTDIDIIKEKSMYCKHGTAYFVADPYMHVPWMEEEIRNAKREVAYYKKRYKNIFRGLCYWKTKALT